MYYLVTGLINKNPQELFVSIIATNAQCTLLKEQPYLIGHTEFEIPYVKLQACLQLLTQEVSWGQLHTCLNTSLKVLQKPRLFRN